MWHPSWEWFSVEFLITPFYDHIQNQKWFHLKFQLLLGWDRVSWERLSITKFMIVSTYLLRKQLPMYKKCSLLKVKSLVSWQNALWLANNSSWLLQSCLYLFQSNFVFNRRWFGSKNVGNHRFKLSCYVLFLVFLIIKIFFLDGVKTSS